MRLKQLSREALVASFYCLVGCLLVLATYQVLDFIDWVLKSSVK